MSFYFVPGGTDAEAEFFGGVGYEHGDEDVVFGVRQAFDVLPADVHLFGAGRGSGCGCGGRRRRRRRMRHHLQTFEAHQQVQRRRSQSVVLFHYTRLG